MIQETKFVLATCVLLGGASSLVVYQQPSEQPEYLLPAPQSSDITLKASPASFAATPGGTMPTGRLLGRIDDPSTVEPTPQWSHAPLSAIPAFPQRLAPSMPNRCTP